MSIKYIYNHQKKDTIISILFSYAFYYAALFSFSCNSEFFLVITAYTGKPINVIITPPKEIIELFIPAKNS